LAAVAGAAAFCWPFLAAPSGHASSTTAPLIFGLLLLLVIAIVLSQMSDGGIDAKALALLGVLAAVNASLRPLGAGTAGVEPMFFLTILAGRVFGAGFGFSLGCVSLFASALITGGVGPWLPYQMFASAWIGALAGALPPARRRREIALLAGYGVVAGYLAGFLLNLSFWPFAVDPTSSIAYLPGASFAEQWHRYFSYDLTTSLGWDTGRAITNVILILLTGPALLRIFRRAARRAGFLPAEPALHAEPAEPARRPGADPSDLPSPPVAPDPSDLPSSPALPDPSARPKPSAQYESDSTRRTSAPSERSCFSSRA